MKITDIKTDLLRVPPTRAARVPLSDAPKTAPRDLTVLAVRLETDESLIGFGFTTMFAGGRSIQAFIEDEITPVLTGCNALEHERLAERMTQNDAGWEIVARAYAPIDIALWDLKGKAAGQPLHKLLGGCRDRAVAYAADTARPWLSADAVIEAAQPLIDDGIGGICVSVGDHGAPADAQKLQRIRDAVGEQLWFSVHGRQQYDVGTALAMGRFLEEELDADWFEDPIAVADRDGYSRLTAKLEVPIAAGSRFASSAEFRDLLTANAVGIVRPDVQRLGGITPWLRVAGLAEAFHRPISPHLCTEIAVHLACGRSGVQAVEYSSWLEPLWQESPKLIDGTLAPPPGPGLGLELRPDAIDRFRV